MLDGNARLNLATFVSTVDGAAGGPAHGRVLRQEHDRQGRVPADGGARGGAACGMLSRLWHAPDAEQAVGCSTTGSSEAAMLGGLALKRRWQHRRRRGQAGRPPHIVMGINVQICWEKFANYWDVEMRLVPMEGERYHLSAEEAVALCDENTIAVVAAPGLDVRRLLRAGRGVCVALDDLQAKTGPRRPGARRRRLRRHDRALRRRGPRVGFQGCPGSAPSTRRATSMASSTRGSAGSSGATRRPCPKTSSSGSTTSATTCPPSRSTSRGRVRRSSPSTTTSCAWASTGFKARAAVRQGRGHVPLG